MPNATRDENGVPVLLGALNTDPSVPIPVKANAITHGLSVENASTGSDTGRPNAPRDENSIPALIAVSADDGVTPVIVYATLNGKLLVDSA